MRNEQNDASFEYNQKLEDDHKLVQIFDKWNHGSWTLPFSILSNYNQIKISTIQQQYTGLNQIYRKGGCCTDSNAIIMVTRIFCHFSYSRATEENYSAAQKWSHGGGFLKEIWKWAELFPRVNVGGSFRNWTADWVGGTAQRFQYLPLISLWSA